MFRSGDLIFFLLVEYGVRQRWFFN